MSIKETDGVFLIINNIPKQYHASHLRNFFSSFIESGGFICFHYRHRPEVQKQQDNERERSRRVTNCCIVKVIANRTDEFIKSYNSQHWLDDKEETLNSCCFIKKFLLSEDNGLCYSQSASYKKGTVSAYLPLERECFSQEDIESLIEMHPPSIMPNGNVGTKTSHFLQEIRECRMPSYLISKLGLQFPRNRSRRIYGNVPFEYKKGSKRQIKKLIGPQLPPEKVFHKKPWCSRSKIKDLSMEDDEEKEDTEDSEEEEWDRVEALHDDVAGQERNKERLFEEKIELKWEKGGSGLVFYTDAQYWDKMEGDFDAKTADDWDIDTRIYEKPGPDNDKDMKDLIRLKLEEKLRNGIEIESDRLYDFAAFEKYSTGFGRKVLESQGWKQGQGVGRHAAGIAEPLPNDGQLPFDKKGFGYRGEKLNRYPVRERRKRRKSLGELEDSVFISTIYDNPNKTDPPESVLASSSFARLKYRKEFLKSHQ